MPPPSSKKLKYRYLMIKEAYSDVKARGIAVRQSARNSSRINLAVEIGKWQKPR
ncbi:hypothetical protein DPMN_154389 [Dreissena polymorpha]|uniref:Uncharacterized protein n=1 Tax=Dreissena polymorpha TaxID=45954 RepID=A0A9D4FKY0_DREPO|nr:hypothetical protein DPMN_154350 [Dreissena polymorpha]KAH3800748.1 hypothetical protein DPMN_154389 [Dreissena polymorpha]